jgi:glycosyltransferase involved in cell wall biosynthesis
MTVWFDVEDLFQTRHRAAPGVQRVTLEIYRALHALDPAGDRVRFVRHGGGSDLFTLVTWTEIAARFAALCAQPQSGAPRQVRNPFSEAAVAQLRSVGELARFGASLFRRPPAPALNATPERFTDLARPGDTFFALGSPWFEPEYPAIARWLRDQRRMRFGLLVHDLLPIRRPEWSSPGVARGFTAWHASTLPLCDVILANSRYTAADVDAYAREQGIPLARPVLKLPIGTGFTDEPDGVIRAGLPAPASYVLFVSTLEPRKNHALAVRIWAMLLAELRAGRRVAEKVPDLVFAGRIGWLVGDLLQQLDNTSWFDGRVRLVPNATERELRALYEGCRFTFFPSLHEGCCLPVAESLAAAKPCLCSNATALPEVGGDLCRYFDPENLTAAYHAVCAVLDDPAGLAGWEERVRREFKPVPWVETARAVLAA